MPRQAFKEIITVWREWEVESAVRIRTEMDFKWDCERSRSCRGCKSIQFPIFFRKCSSGVTLFGPLFFYIKKVSTNHCKVISIQDSRFARGTIYKSGPMNRFYYSPFNKNSLSQCMSLEHFAVRRGEFTLEFTELSHMGYAVS